MAKVLKGVALIALGVVTGNGYLVTAGISKTLGAAASKLAKKQARPAIDLEYAGTVEPRRIIYGQNLVSGMNCLPPVTTGTNNKYLHQVIAIAGHEVNAISTVYFGQDAFGTIGAVSGGASDGLVSTGAYANKAWIRRYVGTSSQTADYILDNALSIWTSNHRLRGVAYIAAQYELDEAVYKNGKEELTCIVQGKKCYDPRLDSSPGANPTNPSYIAYTTNPALCLADYLTDSNLGLGESTSRIDWDMVSDAADICDETVTVPTASTQTRYTCNLVLMATAPYEDNINSIVTCMMGSCLYSGGKWRIRAGAWESATFEITDANVKGPLSLVTAYDYHERYNGVRGTFTDPNNNYQTWEFPAVSNASYVTADGESVYKDVELAGCANVYEAQRWAILMTRKSRNANLFNVVCDMSLWRVRPGDTGIVTITELGLTAATVRCESWKFTPEGLVALQIREELSSDWDDPLEADYLSPTNISNPTPVYFTPSAPSGLTATGTLYGIAFNWTAPTLVPFGAEYELWEYTSSTPFASASRIWRGKATTAVLDKIDLTTRYYWVRLVMPDGTTGTEYPTSSAGVAGTAGLATIINSDAPANGSWNPGAVSASPGFNDSIAVASTSWTNSTGSTVTAEVTYSITAVKNAADSTIFYRIAGHYNDGSDHYETWMNVPEGATSDDYTTRSGSFTVSVANGVTITATARVGLIVPTGIAPTPPGVTYKDAKARITAVVR